MDHDTREQVFVSANKDEIVTKNTADEKEKETNEGQGDKEGKRSKKGNYATELF